MMRFWRAGLLVSLLGVLYTASGCGAPEERYELDGRVVAVDVEGGRVTVDHKAVPGFMDAMTMPFRVVDRRLLPNMQEGDRLRATLVVKGNASWLEELVVSRPNPDAVRPEDIGPEAGSEVPDVALVNQDGEPFQINEFEGKALLITFIYTRCPLPEFCPRMNGNFAIVEDRLASKPELYPRTHLLTISFDPEFDTPEMLRTFALQQSSVTEATFSHWSFATGSQENLRELGSYLGLTYREDEDQIVHNLRTAWVAPDGTLLELYRGYDWTPDQVVEDVERALSSR